ncbi:periplasmic heavy metal sensor [Pseudaestuariivita rosea]|uniref:periplasmic heavy metal sensor n=1 Tax=Pseudaestuariivita rosea TaxID=2763263 RepID=UPI001ABB97B7|nr:periplasmic heavy metal sensor [Pseudaestuariivita rosea]
MAEQTKPSRWIRFAFIGSVALNVLIIGAVIGAIISGVPQRRNFQPDMFMAYARALEPADRRAIGRQLFQDRDSMIIERRRQFAQMFSLLRDETFDAEAVRSLLMDQHAFATERQFVARELLLERLQQMTFDERQTFANRLQDIVNQRRRAN